MRLAPNLELLRTLARDRLMGSSKPVPGPGTFQTFRNARVKTVCAVWPSHMYMVVIPSGCEPFDLFGSRLFAAKSKKRLTVF